MPHKGKSKLKDIFFTNASRAKISAVSVAPYPLYIETTTQSWDETKNFHLVFLLSWHSSRKNVNIFEWKMWNSNRTWLTLWLLPDKDGRLPKLCEEIVIDSSVLVKVEADQSKAGLVDGLLKHVRAAANRWSGERESGRPVPVSGDHQKSELPNPTEITRHFDDCSEMRHGAILMSCTFLLMIH